MTHRIIQGKEEEAWKAAYPLLDDIIKECAVFWTNPLYRKKEGELFRSIKPEAIDDAEARLLRFAPLIMNLFPETASNNGIIESKLGQVPAMQQALYSWYGVAVPGTLYTKFDSHLPISGSIKARGGVYEVLCLSEKIAMEQTEFTMHDNYSMLQQDCFRQLFSQYSIVVGSTGNLGLSIGIMGAALGFRVIVHMSIDAKKWKKDMLRSKGVTVVEHDSDYSKAVQAGREESQENPMSYFIDDESSQCLFLGYSVAAKRLQYQLQEQHIVVDADHPLFVYLPCGVGGGPGGVTFGLKSIFKDNVHCFFAEPTHSPAMLIGLMTGLHEKISVQDFGIDNRTAADGLAVGRPSGLVSKLLVNDIAGVFTVPENEFYKLLKLMADSENKFLEPSALAGFYGLLGLMTSSMGKRFLTEYGLAEKMSKATHIVWATGGSMVPKSEMENFYCLGNK